MSLKSFFQKLFGKKKKRRDEPVRFNAPAHYQEMLATAFAQAMAALEPRGYKHTIATPIKLRFEKGTRHVNGYWLNEDEYGTYIAKTAPSLVITLVTKPDGGPNPDERKTLRHECGHCILYSCGVDGAKHHAILQEARIF